VGGGAHIFYALNDVLKLLGKVLKGPKPEKLKLIQELEKMIISLNGF